ncbi:hypothetical protein BHM03_00046539 [Ensete ventricosum]|nr:hypothetical protein BHM03_00046539 [Ensete ventricosum]
MKMSKVSPRFAISTCTAWYGQYILVRQVTSTRTARYQAVPSKIDRRQPIEEEIGRLRETSTVGGRLREKSTVGSRLRKKKGTRRGKEKKKKGGRKNTSPACRPCPLAVAARGSPVRRRRPRVACAPSPPAATAAAAFSPARGDVIPSLQGQGIGRKIVERITRIITGRGIYDISALCSENERFRVSP